MSYLDEMNKQSRLKFLTLQAEEEKKLIKVYSDAGSKLVQQYKKSADGTITQKMLKEHINHLYSELDPLMKKYGTQMASLPSDLQEYVLTDVAFKAGFNVKLGKMFTSIPNDAMASIIKGDIYKDGKGLSDRIWSSAVKSGKDIQGMVLSGLARGQSAKDMAKALEQFVDPSKRKKSSKDLPFGNVEYNALRLARTTNTHTMLIAEKMSCKKNPFVDGLRWNVSANHSARMHGKDDICDQYNGKVFPIDDYPFEHPNGLCYPTPAISRSTQDIAKELKQWVDNPGSNPKLDSWYASNHADISGLETAVGKVGNLVNMNAQQQKEWDYVSKNFTYGHEGNSVDSVFKVIDKTEAKEASRLAKEMNVKVNSNKSVNISKLASAQKENSTIGLQTMNKELNTVEKLKNTDAGQIKVIRYKGNDIIVDGNHRATLLFGNNIKYVNVDYRDLDDAIKQLAIKEKEIAKKAQDLIDAKIKKEAMNKYGYITSTEKKYTLRCNKLADVDITEYKEGFKIVKSSTMDDGKQLFTPEQIAKEFNKLPEAITKNVKEIQLLDYRSADDLYWEKTYGIKDFRSYASGGNNEIHFYENGVFGQASNDGQLLQTLAHEAGHNFDTAVSGGTTNGLSKSKEWLDIMDKDLEYQKANGITSKYGKYVSQYPMDSLSSCEDFAETVSGYYTDNENFIKNFPNRAKKLEALVKSESK